MDFVRHMQAQGVDPLHVTAFGIVAGQKPTAGGERLFRCARFARKARTHPLIMRSPDAYSVGEAVI